MEQELVLFSKPWLPVVAYYLAGIAAFIICCCLFRLVKLSLNAGCRFLFIIITTLVCAVHMITGYYDVVSYHGYGYNLLRMYHLADYETIRYGVILFITLNGILLCRL
ncbi:MULTISPECIES: hypothetical protein [Enterobacterales]|uniref:hypothetical protein n=1 Tax=Enterobacterales TaxID=91347 RepID=UPI002EDB6405